MIYPFMTLNDDTEIGYKRTVAHFYVIYLL